MKTSNFKRNSRVAIPSNRVNVSYTEEYDEDELWELQGRNPLKSGQCFLQGTGTVYVMCPECLGRNPLKSGQCFLHCFIVLKKFRRRLRVAIPSNRVNVSYH